MGLSFNRAVVTVVVLGAMSTLFSLTALAGKGGVDIYDEGTQRVGELELLVNLEYDPEDEDMTSFDLESLEQRFRSASAYICDATDGTMRIGKVTFVKSPSSMPRADIRIAPDSCGELNHADFDGMGKNGKWIWCYHDKFTKGGAMIAHELGHYTLGLKDQYSGTIEDGPASCGVGAASSSGDISIMHGSEDPLCYEYDDTTDSWNILVDGSGYDILQHPTNDVAIGGLK